ncbi:hypothetical protein ACP275_10G095400 [Erythranthe tilingii]
MGPIPCLQSISFQPHPWRPYPQPRPHRSRISNLAQQSGDLYYAHHLFDYLPHPDAFIYNTMFRGYLQAQLHTNCIILERFVTPNNFSLPPVIRACCSDGAVEEAKQVHAHVVKLGFARDSYCQNNLIHICT